MIEFLLWAYILPVLLCVLLTEMPPFAALIPVLNWFLLPFGIIDRWVLTRRSR